MYCHITSAIIFLFKLFGHSQEIFWTLVCWDMNFIRMFVVKMVIFWCFFSLTGHYRNPLNKYIHHYEGLSYDTELIHSSHQRAKRAVSHEDKFLHLEFHAHGRFVSFLFYLYLPPICIFTISLLVIW